MSKPIYNVIFGVSDVAKILNVDGKTVKDWSYHFASYLSSSANPPKGSIRYFTLEDMRILAYISMYWEDNPDIEYIKYGLNWGEHLDIESITNIITEIIPIFRDFDDGDVGRNDGILLGGMAQIGDMLSIANAYKHAGDKLTDDLLKNGADYELICPVIYQYRHATELFLKSIIGKEVKTHDLAKLYEQFKTIVKTEFSVDIPKWFENVTVAFNDFDPSGTTFRYGGEINRDEAFIDLSHIKTIMEWFAESISNISTLLQDKSRS